CRVIGTAGSPEKAALAKAHGCDEVILYRSEDTAKRVKELNGGEGVPVVYDSVGKDTFMSSLDSLRLRGMLVSFGNASGAVEPFTPLLLLTKGALYITRPTLFHYTVTTEELDETAADFFEVVLKGTVKVEIGQRYKLAEAAQAHRDLESRQTVGASILIP